MKPIKELESLIASGFGTYVRSIRHEVLGAGLYKIELVNCKLCMFEDGVVVEWLTTQECIMYLDILNIKSHLSVDVFSQAAEDKDLNVVLPLELICSNRDFALEVQLLVYSRLLIVLNKLWRVNGGGP
ncbi:hypothetical protein [Pseudomonas sp. A34-9]|uniref:hypothetical protein n=1 Tax=Pseudomonas sp. A34-9 TaxID=3034675 RepID=UPI00240D9B86|nr:hypothetical protein [Pseudomonas sp. A34-9]